MLCPKCKAENAEDTNVCTSCGAHLRATVPSARRNSIRLWILAGVFIVLGGLFLIYKFNSTRKSEPFQIDTAVIESSPHELTPEARVSLRRAQGRIITQSSLGMDISQIDSAVVSGNWIALPICAGLSGANWIFRTSASDEAKIVGGLWTSGSPVGLWQLEQGKEYDSLQLTPWNRGAPIEWHPLKMESPVRQVAVLSPKQEGFFTSISLSQDLNKPGVFVQENQIIGWTFDEWMHKGFLWDPPPGFHLEQNLDFYDFLHSISADWQETQFSKGLALGKEATPAEKIAALAEGFLLFPQFSSEIKPPSLYPESVASVIHSLASKLIENGSSKVVMDVLTEDIIIKAADPELLKVTTLARANFRDHWEAVQYFERLKRRLFREDERTSFEFAAFHAQLYKDWVKQSLEKGIFHSGRIGFEAGKSLFPDDVDLHLLGIDLALAEKDWDRAEELLKMRDYPSEYNIRVKRMESLIEDRIEEERTVVVRFNPGSNKIPVRAYLNRRIWQDFVIDTGAEITSIPSKAVIDLGIKITDATAVRAVSGIVGVGLTYEVVLDSIAINGFNMRNIPVYIIDLPGLPNVGLMGSDFLKHFDIEIDNENGIFKMQPRK